MDEKLCDERHAKIDGALERIETKLDWTIWKMVGLMIAVIALIFAGIKFVV